MLTYRFLLPSCNSGGFLSFKPRVFPWLLKCQALIFCIAIKELLSSLNQCWRLLLIGNDRCWQVSHTLSSSSFFSLSSWSVAKISKSTLWRAPSLHSQLHVLSFSLRNCSSTRYPIFTLDQAPLLLYFDAILFHVFFVILFVSLRNNDCAIWNHYLVLSPLRYQVSTHFVQSTSIRRENANRFVGLILESRSWAMLEAQRKIGLLWFWLLLFLESQFGFAVWLLRHQSWNELISAYSGVSIQVHSSYDCHDISLACHLLVLPQEVLEILRVDVAVAPIVDFVER